MRCACVHCFRNLAGINAQTWLWTTSPQQRPPTAPRGAAWSTCHDVDLGQLYRVNSSAPRCNSQMLHRWPVPGAVAIATVNAVASLWLAGLRHPASKDAGTYHLALLTVIRTCPLLTACNCYCGTLAGRYAPTRLEIMLHRRQRPVRLAAASIRTCRLTSFTADQDTVVPTAIASTAISPP